jgi:hypothetical protein
MYRFSLHSGVRALPLACPVLGLASFFSFRVRQALSLPIKVLALEPLPGIDVVRAEVYW